MDAEDLKDGIDLTDKVITAVKKFKTMLAEVTKMDSTIFDMFPEGMLNYSSYQTMCELKGYKPITQIAYNDVRNKATQDLYKKLEECSFYKWKVKINPGTILVSVTEFKDAYDFGQTLNSDYATTSDKILSGLKFAETSALAVCPSDIGDFIIKAIGGVAKAQVNLYNLRRASNPEEYKEAASGFLGSYIDAFSGLPITGQVLSGIKDNIINYLETELDNQENMNEIECFNVYDSYDFEYVPYEDFRKAYFEWVYNHHGKDAVDYLRDKFGIKREGFDDYKDHKGDTEQEDFNDGESDKYDSTKDTGKSDPLILDLNNDKTFTSSINGNTHFDFNGDGFLEKTGWVSSGDGLLVRDINKNAQIDNGSELFGDQTVLKDGTIAKSGFEALSDLDDNKDNVIDSKDSSFSELLVWKDENADGITQSNELYTLSDLNIKSIDLSSTNLNVVDSQGNLVNRSAEFTFGDNTRNSIGEISFTTDKTNTTQSPSISDVIVPDDISLYLPNLSGSGTLLSLHQAMALDEKLVELVNEYISNDNIRGSYDIIKKMLLRWANCDNIEINSRGSYVDASVLAFLEKYFGSEFLGRDGKNPNNRAGPMLTEIFGDIVVNVSNNFLVQTKLCVYLADTTVITYKDGTKKIDYSLAKERFNIERLKNAERANLLFAEYIRYIKNDDIFSLEDLKNQFSDIPSFNNAIEIGLKDKWLFGNNSNAYSTNDYLFSGSENDKLSGGDGNDIFDGEAGNDSLNGGYGNDTYIFGLGYGTDTITDNNGTNTIKFLEGIKPEDLLVTNLDGYDLMISIRGTTDKLILDNFRLEEEFQNFTFEFADGTTMVASDINGPLRNIMGTNGDDNMSSVYSLDTIIYGLEGNDTLNGSGQNDELYGGVGNDTLHGNAGNDIFDGGAGDDFLDDYFGNDTYIFGLGYGTDTINDYNGTNTIKFLEGIKPEDLLVTNEGSGYYDTTLLIRGTTDKLILSRFRDNERYQNFTFEFADGTTMHANDINSPLRNIVGTSDGETLNYVYSLDTIINGLEGNDTLNGSGQNDKLYGGEGNDTLHGNAGNDIFDGGTGDDLLEDYSGNDTYIFGLGYGTDTINDYNGTNTIKFLEGIKPEDLLVTNEGSGYYDTTLLIRGTTDKLILTRFREYERYQNFTFEFADGTTMVASDISSLLRNITGTNGDDNISAVYSLDTIINGLEGNDNITSYSGNDILDGGAGNDVINAGDGNDKLYGGDDNDKLYGQGGNDIFDGGAGDDLLEDYSGNDTYIFGLGYGTDTINDYSGTNTIKFLEGIKPEDLLVTNEGSGYYDTTLLIRGTTDKLILTRFREYERYQNFTFEFADGTSMHVSDENSPLRNLVGTLGVETINAIYSTGTKMYGLDGNDTLNGNSGNDMLYGGTGDDILNGYDGNDVLDGGEGNDTLNGGNGYNTYIFGLGYGKDVINGYGGTNTIKFLEGISSEDILVTLTGTYDITLSIRDTTDSLVFKSFRSNSSYNNFTLEFADGKAGKVNLNTMGIDMINNEYQFNNNNLEICDNAGNDVINTNADILDLIFSHNNNNLVVTNNETQQNITIIDWFTDPKYQIEEFKTDSGYSLTNLQVQSLIDNMASFTSENNISWSEAINTSNQNIQPILEQFWTKA